MPEAGRPTEGANAPFFQTAMLQTAMDIPFKRNFFELFGLPPGFGLDAADLDRSYRELQQQVHPDRFANASDAERRASMQWATHVNEAYRTLKDPIPRAAYLLALHGIDPKLETGTSMPPEFLTEQMEWRESVEAASLSGDIAGLENLSLRVRNERERLCGEIARQLDDRADDAAAATLRKLKFLERIGEEIGDALECIES